MKRRKKTILIPTLMILCVLSMVTLAVAFKYEDERRTEMANSSIPVLDKHSANANYITDTSYNGSTPVDTVLFLTPFQKTEQYVMNKDFVGNVTAGELQELETDAADFIEKAYGTGFHEIENNKNAFKERVSSMYPEGSILTLDNGSSMLATDYSDKLATWYIDHKMQSEVKFTTADCLVYLDHYYYVRGRMDVAPYNGKGGDTGLFPSGIDLSKEASYVVEVSLRPSPDGEKNLVTGVNVLGVIK